MNFCKPLYALSVVFIFIAMQSCAQNANSKQEIKKQLTAKDSVKLNHYFDKLERTPLFAQKRGLYIDSVLAISPKNAYLWQQRAMPLFKQKKYEIGMPYLDKAVEYAPKRYMDYRAFMKCIFSKNYTEAIQDFKAAEKLNGKSVVMDHPYDFYMGLCYLQLNQLDSAEYLISQVIEDKRKAHPNDETWVHFLHLFYMGVVLFEKEDYSKAIIYFDKSLKQYAQFSDVKYYKAICLDNMGQRKEALALMIEASNDLEKGYTINEDNAIYETYPYQINEFYLKGYIKSLSEESK